MHSKKVFFSLLGLVLVLVIFDQWTKWYIKTHFSLHEIIPVFGNWFHLFFIENTGMAFGWKFGGDGGKLLLTLIRLVAVVLGFFLIRRLTLKMSLPLGSLIFICLIYAGAIGNMIDSLCYGLIYSESTPSQVATLFPDGGGYGSLFYGKVVDMLYFPLIRTQLPTWIPLWGGQDFEFFSPVFNIADSCVTIGSFGIVIFYYKALFGKKENVEKSHDIAK